MQNYSFQHAPLSFHSSVHGEFEPIIYVRPYRLKFGGTAIFIVQRGNAGPTNVKNIITAAKDRASDCETYKQ